MLFQTSDETWQAYNDYGGHSLYGGAGTWDLPNRAYKVSYNRPFDTRQFESASWIFNAEYPMVRWLEANGYDVTYFTGIDAARSGSLIQNHKIYVTAGHDEYVSGPQRTNIESARDAGVNLAFFTGNEYFWKTRWENSIDGSGTAYRTLVCYKETYTGTKLDPADPPTWTGSWRDPRLSPPADGGRPENALTGTLFMVNGPGNDNVALTYFGEDPAQRVAYITLFPLPSGWRVNLFVYRELTVQKLIESLRDAFEAYIQYDARTRPDPRYFEQAHRQHEAIAAALQARRPDRARALMQEHLEQNAVHYTETVAESQAGDAAAA